MTSRQHLIPTKAVPVSSTGSQVSARRRAQAAMLRFFFHVRDESEFTRDDEGQLFPDLKAARAEALRAIEVLTADLPPDFAERDIAFEITDERGPIVLTLPLRPAERRQARWTAQIIQGPWV
jgi:hypothetical protein